MRTLTERLQLLPYEETTEEEETRNCWYYASQQCATSWAVVYLTEADFEEVDSSGQPYYYVNRITGETSWEPPSNWADIASSWGSWILCCADGDVNQPYWCGSTSSLYLL